MEDTQTRINLGLERQRVMLVREDQRRLVAFKNLLDQLAPMT